MTAYENSLTALYRIVVPLVLAGSLLAPVHAGSGVAAQSLLAQANEDDWGWDWGDPAETDVSEISRPEPSGVSAPASAPEETSITQVAPEPRPGAVTTQGVDEAGVEDWSWGESPEAAETAAGATPAEPSDEPGASEAVAGGDDWDWDWSEIPAAAPAKPVTRKRAGAKRDKMAALRAARSRVGSTAEPDYSGEISTAYRMFAGVSPFEVIPSKKDPDMHPCLDCHEWAESDLTPRELQEPHDNFKLKHGLHGKGEFWCFTCHHLEGDGGLRTLEGLKVPFDEAYIVCSQCHAQETRDWYFGAHGKRVDNWRGDRRLLNCTACHYQHKPNLAPKKALPGPTMRMGMERPEHWAPRSQHGHGVDHDQPAWQRIVEKRSGESP